MENTEQSNQVSIDLEATGEDLPDKMAETNPADSLTDPANQPQSDEIAKFADDSEQAQEQGSISSEESQTMSSEEVSQILIDLSDAQERSAKLTEEKRLLYEQLIRRQAEFENFRKRIDRERLETQAKARADIISELLPVLDNLERALSSTNETNDSAQEGILAGVKLIHRQFYDVLAGLGLKPVIAVGEPFDPHLHEAVTTEINDQLPESTVTAELQRGYKLGDKLLRPAMVKVSVRE
jgi:molecular chaperone GrpE